MRGLFFKKSLFWILVIASITLYSICMLYGKYGFEALIFWLISCVLVVVYKKKGLSFNFSVKKVDFMAYIAVLTVGFIYLLRFVLLWYGPDWLFVHHDEAMLSKYALEGIRLGIQDGEWNFMGSFLGTVTRFPAIWYYMTGSLIYVFGPSFFSVKLLALFTDFAIALCVYVLMRRWYGPLTGIIAGVVYASLPAALHFGMTGYQNIQSTLCLMIIWILIDRSFSKEINHKEKQWYIFSAGLISGVSMYFYLSSVLIPVWVVMWILFFARKSGMSIYVSLREYAAGFLLTSTPFWIYKALD